MAIMVMTTVPAWAASVLFFAAVFSGAVLSSRMASERIRRLAGGLAVASVVAVAVFAASVLVPCPIYAPNCCNDWYWCLFFGCCW